MLIVTRHDDAVAWLRSKGYEGDVVTHMSDADVAALPAASMVIGVLPLHLAVAVIQAGHRFVSLQLEIPADLRGKELTVEAMQDIASLMELVLESRRDGDEWAINRSGRPDGVAGDLQQFRIGFVPVR